MRVQRYSYDSFQARGRYQDIKKRPGLDDSNKGNRGRGVASAGEQVSDVPQTHGSYQALVLHPKWKARRKAILDRDRHCCVVCQSRKALHVHHRQYHFVVADNQFKPPWDYADHLLLTLCVKCHAQGHSKYKIPIIKL